MTFPLYVIGVKGWKNVISWKNVLANISKGKVNNFWWCVKYNWIDDSWKFATKPATYPVLQPRNILSTEKTNPEFHL